MKRGFTLFELLATLLLLGVAFVAAADLARDLASFHRLESDETRRTVAARQVLDYLAGEAARAVRVTPGSTLSLEQVDTSSPLYPALPLPPSPSLPAGWQPDQPRLTVDFRLVGPDLVREQGGQSLVLLRDVTGFSATIHGRVLTLSLSWSRRGQLQSLARVVYLPVRSSP